MSPKEISRIDLSEAIFQSEEKKKKFYLMTKKGL